MLYVYTGFVANYKQWLLLSSTFARQIASCKNSIARWLAIPETKMGWGHVVKYGERDTPLIGREECNWHFSYFFQRP